MISWQVFWSILQTFLMFCIGGFVLRKGIIRKDDLPRLNTLSIDVFTPFLTFSAIARGAAITLHGKDMLILPLVGAGVMLTGWILGILTSYLLAKKTSSHVRTYEHLCAINNYFFLPLIIIQNIWPEDGHIMLLLLMNIGSTIGFWSVGIISIAKHQSFKDVCKALCSMNMLAIVLGLLVMWGDWNLPVVVSNTCKMLGDMAIPFMMVLSGASVMSCSGWKNIVWRDALLVNVMRLAVVPLVCICLLKILPLSQAAYEVGFIYAVMPSAVISILVAGQHDAEEGFAGQVIVSTTILSMLTVPLWMHFL